MTTRVQEKNCVQQALEKREPRMGMLEKCMLRSAVFDPADKVLDANVCSGQVAEYLLRNMECEVCGVSDRMEEVRRTRARMYSGDFVYAAIGDIPWQDETFDTVLLHPGECDPELLRVQLAECGRVLKPGGQLVLGLKGTSAALRRLTQLFWETPEEATGIDTAGQLMQVCGFEHIIRQHAGLNAAVLIGWKNNPVA